MKANELRIGNLFKFGVFIRVAKASDIADLEFIDKLDKKHSPYKPIPLTKEWLVKFGFQLQNLYFALAGKELTIKD
jgi:hypothetical protein